MDFHAMFQQATGQNPFPYQQQLAVTRDFPSLLDVPTGMGKTAAAILGWLWRRRFAPRNISSNTPRRLVYCLPMRGLVEQTRNCAVTWLHRLNLLGGSTTFEERNGNLRLKHYDPWTGDDDSTKIRLHVLLGGDIDRDWDSYPERDAILIGTQDMLLSRALNRGYAMSRFRWPVQFGLLNSDCLWVMDEVQLMGNGLATSAQLQAFRRIFSTAIPTQSLWMSATIHADWLKTVDFNLFLDAPCSIGLLEEDRNSEIFRERFFAKKALEKAPFQSKGGKETAALAIERHVPGTRTLVIVNTVKRAQEVFRTLSSIFNKRKDPQKPELVLLHSRFRQPDRELYFAQLLASPGPGGTIAVCTQVIEAGVDVSAKTLITELAPWPSLVQRFGRCNRYGEYEKGSVVWIPLGKDRDIQKTEAAPYDVKELLLSMDQLDHLSDVGLYALPDCSDPLLFTHVIRRKDILELYDTSPDISGADIDISRFIRETDEHDVQVFWRNIPPEGPSSEEKEPAREELCAVAIDKKLMEKKLWRWDHLEKRWRVAKNVFPGLVLLVASDQGGYDSILGWTGESVPTPPLSIAGDSSPEGNDDDPKACSRIWQTIAQHTECVLSELNRLLDSDLGGFLTTERAQLMESAQWHDVGKAHEIYQKAVPENTEERSKAWGKSAQPMKRYERTGFRHELASALAVLANGGSDLVAYLAAAHHGKVRMSIRSLPNEKHPPRIGLRFARGIWDGDVLPKTELCPGVWMPQTVLQLNHMEVGEDVDTGTSWMERTLGLRNRFGPFRLAFLEALLRIADWRASDNEMDQTGERTP